MVNNKGVPPELPANATTAETRQLVEEGKPRGRVNVNSSHMAAIGITNSAGANRLPPSHPMSRVAATKATASVAAGVGSGATNDLARASNQLLARMANNSDNPIPVNIEVKIETTDKDAKVQVTQLPASRRRREANQGPVKISPNESFGSKTPIV